MNNSGTIAWKDKVIGRVTNLVSDMWYLDADWQRIQSEDALKFEDIASKLQSDEIIKDPAKGIVALLQFDDNQNSSDYVLILGMDKSKIFMRFINDEIAVYADKRLMKPWQQVENSAFYEKELKREITFFHVLYWKKVNAIGIRTDRDDVLFEVLNGRNKYAVVHLTYAKERSRKFPLTRFYKDWADVYKNRLLEDQKEWKDD
jgi:hypothetical protein